MVITCLPYSERFGSSPMVDLRLSAQSAFLWATEIRDTKECWTCSIPTSCLCPLSRSLVVSQRPMKWLREGTSQPLGRQCPSCCLQIIMLKLELAMKGFETHRHSWKCSRRNRKCIRSTIRNWRTSECSSFWIGLRRESCTRAWTWSATW